MNSNRPVAADNNIAFIALPVRLERPIVGLDFRQAIFEETCGKVHQVSPSHRVEIGARDIIYVVAESVGRPRIKVGADSFAS